MTESTGLPTKSVIVDSDKLLGKDTNLFISTFEYVRDYMKTKMFGSATSGWRDLTIALTGLASGGAAPALTAFGPSGTIKQLKFNIGDSVYFIAHIDHDILVGANVLPHVHWTTDGTSTNTVKWEITCIIAKGHNQANYGTDVVITLEEAAQGTAWRHMITEDATGFDPLEIDSLWIGELKRISNGGTDNTDAVFANTIDIHYQTDRIATKNRSPNFYT